MPEPCPAKLDLPFETDEQILDLVAQFEACRWPCERWTHRAHLAVAAFYLTLHSFPEALIRMRQGIQAYNRVCCQPDGYHETITVVFLTLVQNFLATHTEPRPLAATVADLFARFDSKAPLTYYSPDRLSSAAAKKAWLEPDLKPLTLAPDFVP
jgi:hypothetical protein